jgi:predicted flap endonuclease-1-like 5' DNA nuclease
MADPRLVKTADIERQLRADLRDVLIEARDAMLDVLQDRYPPDGQLGGIGSSNLVSDGGVRAPNSPVNRASDLAPNDEAERETSAISTALKNAALGALANSTAEGLIGLIRPKIKAVVERTYDKLTSASGGEGPALDVSFDPNDRQAIGFYSNSVENQVRNAGNAMYQSIADRVRDGLATGQHYRDIEESIGDEFSGSKIADRAGLISRMEVQKAVSGSRMREYRSSDVVNGIRVINPCDENTTRLCKSLAGCGGREGALAWFDHPEGLSVAEQLREQAPEGSLYSGFSLASPPYHFGCRSGVIPVVEEFDEALSASDLAAAPGNIGNGPRTGGKPFAIPSRSEFPDGEDGDRAFNLFKEMANRLYFASINEQQGYRANTALDLSAESSQPDEPSDDEDGDVESDVVLDFAAESYATIEGADVQLTDLEWNPALHPRDPETGQFVERPWDVPDEITDLETDEIIQELASIDPEFGAKTANLTVDLDDRITESFRTIVDNALKDAGHPTTAEAVEESDDDSSGEELEPLPEDPEELVGETVRVPEGVTYGADIPEGDHEVTEAVAGGPEPLAEIDIGDGKKPLVPLSAFDGVVPDAGETAAGADYTPGDELPDDITDIEGSTVEMPGGAEDYFDEPIEPGVYDVEETFEDSEGMTEVWLDNDDTSSTLMLHEGNFREHFGGEMTSDEEAALTAVPENLEEIEGEAVNVEQESTSTLGTTVEPGKYEVEAVEGEEMQNPTRVSISAVDGDGFFQLEEGPFREAVEGTNADLTDDETGLDPVPGDIEELEGETIRVASGEDEWGDEYAAGDYEVMSSSEQNNSGNGYEGPVAWFNSSDGDFVGIRPDKIEGVVPSDDDEETTPIGEMSVADVVGATVRFSGGEDSTGEEFPAGEYEILNISGGHLEFYDANDDLMHVDPESETVEGVVGDVPPEATAERSGVDPDPEAQSIEDMPPDELIGSTVSTDGGTDELGDPFASGTYEVIDADSQGDIELEVSGSPDGSVIVSRDDEKVNGIVDEPTEAGGGPATAGVTPLPDDPTGDDLQPVVGETVRVEEGTYYGVKVESGDYEAIEIGTMTSPPSIRIDAKQFADPYIKPEGVEGVVNNDPFATGDESGLDPLPDDLEDAEGKKVFVPEDGVGTYEDNITGGVGSVVNSSNTAGSSSNGNVKVEFDDDDTTAVNPGVWVDREEVEGVVSGGADAPDDVPIQPIDDSTDPEDLIGEVIDIDETTDGFDKEVAAGRYEVENVIGGDDMLKIHDGTSAKVLDNDDDAINGIARFDDGGDGDGDTGGLPEDLNDLEGTEIEVENGASDLWGDSLKEEQGEVTTYDSSDDSVSISYANSSGSAWVSVNDIDESSIDDDSTTTESSSGVEVTLDDPANLPKASVLEGEKVYVPPETAAKGDEDAEVNEGVWNVTGSWASGDFGEPHIQVDDGDGEHYVAYGDFSLMMPNGEHADHTKPVEEFEGTTVGLEKAVGSTSADFDEIPEGHYAISNVQDLAQVSAWQADITNLSTGETYENVGAGIISPAITDDVPAGGMELPDGLQPFPPDDLWDTKGSVARLPSGVTTTEGTTVTDDMAGDYKIDAADDYLEAVRLDGLPGDEWVEVDKLDGIVPDGESDASLDDESGDPWEDAKFDPVPSDLTATFHGSIVAVSPDTTEDHYDDTVPEDTLYEVKNTDSWYDTVELEPVGDDFLTEYTVEKSDLRGVVPDGDVDALTDDTENSSGAGAAIAPRTDDLFAGQTFAGEGDEPAVEGHEDASYYVPTYSARTPAQMLKKAELESGSIVAGNGDWRHPSTDEQERFHSFMESMPGGDMVMEDIDGNPNTSDGYSLKGKAYSDAGQRYERGVIEALGLDGDVRNDKLNGPEPSDEYLKALALFSEASRAYLRDELERVGTDDESMRLHHGVSDASMPSFWGSFFANPESDEFTVKGNAYANYTTSESTASSFGRNALKITEDRHIDDLVGLHDALSPTNYQNEAEMAFEFGTRTLSRGQMELYGEKNADLGSITDIVKGEKSSAGKIDKVARDVRRALIEVRIDEDAPDELTKHKRDNPTPKYPLSRDLIGDPGNDINSAKDIADSEYVQYQVPFDEDALDNVMKFRENAAMSIGDTGSHIEQNVNERREVQDIPHVGRTPVDASATEPLDADGPADLEGLSSFGGVGESKAQALSDAGFNRPEDVVDATPDELQQAEGIGPTTANKLSDEGSLPGDVTADGQGSPPADFGVESTHEYPLSDDQFEGYDPTDILENDTMKPITATGETTGVSAGTMSVTEAEVIDETVKSFNTAYSPGMSDTLGVESHGDPEEIGRSMVGFAATRAFGGNTPAHQTLDDSTGTPVGTSVLGFDGENIGKAPDEWTDKIDDEQFLDEAAVQLLAGNIDAHTDNMMVDEDGNITAPDLDHAGGALDNDITNIGNKGFSDAHRRAANELGRVAKTLDLDPGDSGNVEQRILDHATEYADQFWNHETGAPNLPGHVKMRLDDARVYDDGMVENVLDNIRFLAEEEPEY